MLDVKSAGDFAVERPIPLNDLEGVRIINAINPVFFFHLKIQVKIPIPGNFQGQVEWGSEQHGLVKGVPYSRWEVGMR